MSGGYEDIFIVASNNKYPRPRCVITVAVTSTLDLCTLRTYDTLGINPHTKKLLK